MDAEFASRELQKQDLAIEVLRNAGKVRFAARGFSMLPTLWPGDLLTVETTSFEQICSGDVVLYCRWERLFIHRVLRKSAGPSGSERPTLVTRGDSMTGVDAAVLPAELLGKVVSVERSLGKVGPVPKCSTFRRVVGLSLGHSDRLLSLVIRWRNWRGPGRAANGVLAKNAPSSGDPTLKFRTEV